jgi:hypothetical protein
MRMIVVWLPYWKRFRMPAWVFLVYWIGLQLLSFAVGDGPVGSRSSVLVKELPSRSGPLVRPESVARKFCLDHAVGV